MAAERLLFQLKITMVIYIVIDPSRIDFIAFTVAEIGLQQTSYLTTETSGTVEVCALLKNGSLECNVTVLLSTSNGTAIGMLVQVMGCVCVHVCV